MCNECCTALRGWCKSFTRTETLLIILEAILLVICIAFLVFLILHFVSCSKPKKDEIDLTTSPDIYNLQTYESSTVTSTANIVPGSKTTQKIKCTWKVSEKTEAVTHYYENERGISNHTKAATTPITIAALNNLPQKEILEDIDNLAMDDQSDGEEADNIYKTFVLALVKLKPSRKIIFGCILTVITNYWTLTAASCIESIEEVDSLDSFVMMEGYGEVRQSRTHAVADVQIHPQYQGANKSYDLAALKSEYRLNRRNVVELPTMVDYFLITIGERFTILGFGGYRVIDKGASSRRLRGVQVYSVPWRLCPAQGSRDSWAPRHLSPGQPVGHAPCGTAPLCAGGLYARGAPCNYCAGTPLLRGALLLGLMSDNTQCGISCEPLLYVNIAVVRDWLNSILYDEINK